MKKLIKKIVPKFIFKFYHWMWAFVSALYFRFPSKDMVVVGITGTKGKSSSVYILSKILEGAGLGVAVSSSLIFKIKEREWVNPYHMTMVGRFKLQKLLKEAKDAGCKYVVIEVTSEGILQSRHKFIDFDVVVFTNLSKEHIEAHGGFENYKKTKGKLFSSLAKSKRKVVDGKKVSKTIVANLDDKNAEYFLSFDADKKIGFSLKGGCDKKGGLVSKCFFAEDLSLQKNGSSFSVFGERINLNILGEFNVYNTLSAIACADVFGVSLQSAKKSVESINSIPGRMKRVNLNADFEAFVDLAHTPSSYEAVFNTVKLMRKKGGRIISLFGSAGGGRDKWKRPEMGKIASMNSDIIILTGEDSYEEDPKDIIDDIKKGVLDGDFLGELIIILDRKEAISKALKIAKKDDIVLFLGKGTEKTIEIGGKSIPWDEEEIIKKKFNEIKSK